MSELMYVCVGLAIVNAAMAAGLVALYGRNVREMRSWFTVGLAVFGGLLLVYNVTQLVHFVTMMPAFADVGEGVMVFEGALQTGALAVLMATSAR